MNGKSIDLRFTAPIIWHQRTDHTTDCYFWCTKIFGFSSKNRNNIVYANAARPILHSEGWPVAICLNVLRVEHVDTQPEKANEIFLKENSHLKTIHLILIIYLEVNDLVRALDYQNLKQRY